MEPADGIRHGRRWHTARRGRTCLPGWLRHAELPRPGDGDRQLRDDAHRHVRRNDHAVAVGSQLDLDYNGQPARRHILRLAAVVLIDQRGGRRAPQARGMLIVIAKAAEHKVEYIKYGAIGWCAAIGMGVLCNWLVSLGSVMSKATRSTVGRVVLMWIPIAMFFALGFEHTVVNMWLFPTAILSGANVSIYEWWVWNQIPVTIGNILGAMVLNGTLWYYTHTLQK